MPHIVQQKVGDKEDEHRREKKMGSYFITSTPNSYHERHYGNMIWLCHHFMKMSILISHQLLRRPNFQGTTEYYQWEKVVIVLFKVFHQPFSLILMWNEIFELINADAYILWEVSIEPGAKCVRICEQTKRNALYLLFNVRAEVYSIHDKSKTLFINQSKSFLPHSFSLLWNWFHVLFFLVECYRIRCRTWTKKTQMQTWAWQINHILSPGYSNEFGSKGTQFSYQFFVEIPVFVVLLSSFHHFPSL